MEEQNTPKKEVPLVVWLGLLAVLVLGVVLIFAMLEVVIPKPAQPAQEQPPVVSVQEEAQTPAAGTQEEVQAPRFCIHCGKALPDSFRWGQYCPYCGTLVEWEEPEK